MGKVFVVLNNMSNPVGAFSNAVEAGSLAATVGGNVATFHVDPEINTPSTGAWEVALSGEVVWGEGRSLKAVRLVPQVRYEGETIYLDLPPEKVYFGGVNSFFATVHADSKEGALSKAYLLYEKELKEVHEERENAAKRIEPSLMEELACLVANDQVISAVKLYRERSGCGLKESKEVIDALRRSKK